MSYRHIQLSAEASRSPWTHADPPGPPRPLDDIVAELQQAHEAGEQLVVFRGADPLQHPTWKQILQACRDRDLAVSLRVDPHQLEATPDLETLRRKKVEILWLPLHGPASAHDLRVQRAGAWEATLAILRQTARPRVRVEVCASASTAHHIAEAVAAAAPHAEQVLIRNHPDDPVPLDQRPALLDAVWTALRHHPATCELQDLTAPPDLDPGDRRPYDETLFSLRLQGGWLPGLAGGVRGAPAGQQRALHALGMPDQPPPDRLLPPVREPVAVIAPAIEDTLLATSTLPGLTWQLRRRGVDAHLHSVWDAPWNLYGQGAFDPEQETAPPHPEVELHRARQRVQTAHSFGEAFLQHLDLRGVGTVVVPGWQQAWQVLRHPSRAPDTEVVVLDFHLLHGVSAWQTGAQRAVEGAWWPDAPVRVWSCFPGYAANYLQAGVPLERVWWRPYPIFQQHLPTGGPVLAADQLAAAGNHRRAHGLLREACEHLDIRPIRLHTSAQVASVGPLRPAGHVPVAGLHQTLQQSRFVILPLSWSAQDAAGITLAAMALAAGRPVIASRTWAMLDHLRHDVNALLVPPDDARALAEAITTLDRDDALATRLADGARAAAAEGSAARAAQLLHTGEESVWPVR